MGGGAPGRLHTAMYQWCTRLKLSLAAGGLTARSPVGAPSVTRVMGGAPERNNKLLEKNVV